MEKRKDCEYYWGDILQHWPISVPDQIITFRTPLAFHYLPSAYAKLPTEENNQPLHYSNALQRSKSFSIVTVRTTISNNYSTIQLLF